MVYKSILLWLLLVLSARFTSANVDWFAFCLDPYRPLTTVAIFPTEEDSAGQSYTGANGESIQVYETLSTGAVFIVVNNAHLPCARPAHEGDLPTITLYPLGGTRFTWSVQDRHGSWHQVRLLTGELASTPIEYAPDGRAFTRLPVRRDQPLEPGRYHIFDENGNRAG